MPGGNSCRRQRHNRPIKGHMYLGRRIKNLYKKLKLWK